LQHPLSVDIDIIESSKFCHGLTSIGDRTGWTACSPKSTEKDRNLEHAVGETPFVVVPSKDTNEPLVEHLRLGHIEGSAMWVVVEIDRDRRRFADAEYPAQSG
jgi:hypothetical protein